MATKEAIDNQSAKQRAADKVTTGQTASGHNVSTAFDSVDNATTVGAAGGASALPATPVGYTMITIGGVLFKMAYYNP
jgi:hypothetical protein